MKNPCFATWISVSVLLLTASAACADDATKNLPAPPRYTQEGRPADPVPPATGGIQLTPPPTGAAGQMQVGSPGVSDPKYGGVLYEKNRVKRTVPLDASGGPSGRWDVLYRFVDGVSGETAGGAGTKTVYCDWDDQYLYLAMETPSPTEVRFDIDGTDDGWLRGADNLMVQISPPAGSGAPTVLLQRFDTTQNKDRPVYAESSIPPGEVRASAAQTARGTYAVLLAIPSTERIGLTRKAGAAFGLRVDTGLMPAQTGPIDFLSVRPMLRLNLVDAVAAQSENGLSLKVGIANARKNVPGEEIKISLEAKNESKEPLRLARLFLRGSLGSQNLLDASTFTGVILAPGQRLRRDLRSAVSPSAETGTYVVAGGAEWEDGTAIASLAAFDRLEPYALELKLDEKPVQPGTIVRKNKKGEKQGPDGEVRTAVVAVLSRVAAKETASVRIRLPESWTLESGDSDRTVRFTYGGDLRPLFFKIVVPRKAAPGSYPILVTLEVAGKTYTASRTLSILGDSGTPEKSPSQE
ncbi:MAG: hypothetical protein H7Z41_16175 [Cytophagales bacterium]|nr:hypothetical protein [Armatimonadota bacterium]